MEARSPEFVQHWLAGQETGEGDHAERRSDDPLSQAQQEALEELEGRVVAARSVY